MSELQIESSKVLNKYFQKKSSLKTLCFNQNIKEKV